MENIYLKLRGADMGSVQKQTQKLWVYEKDEMVYRSVSYVPALYNIFDEILAMAAAKEKSDPSMSLKVTIDVDQNLIRVHRSDGYPPLLHRVGCLCTELIPVRLARYNHNKINLSTTYVNDTDYGTLELEYKEVCSNNSNFLCVTGCTVFSFKPDLAKFNMTELEDDVVALMKKRVVDWAGILGKSGNVELDAKCVSVNSFADYVSLYLQAESKSRLGSPPFPSIAKKFGDRWEICVSRSDRLFQQQVSFVNGFATIKGGTHVDYVTNQISNHLVDVANQQKEKPIIINADTIKKYLWVFVNCLIDEPTFDSPTKESLVTPPESFGSKCELSPEFLNEVEESWLVYNILQWEYIRQPEPMKKTDRVEKQRVTGSECLVDAKEAFEKQRITGTNRHKCTLILTVGDLAESFASRGICCGGRYGLFFSSSHLLSSEERFDQLYERNGDIQAVKGLLGLEEGKQYQSAETLRYHHLMIMADTEHAGSHFIGVLINYIHSYWPSLLRIPSFLLRSITPTPKGLSGSWEEEEVKEYFSNLDNHKKEFVWEDNQDGDAIELAFNTSVDDWKDWIKDCSQEFKRDAGFDWKEKRIRYRDFVSKELILFTMAKLQREIPSMVDGLKPCQRKILFCCLKLGSVKKLSVDQLALHILKHSSCHCNYSVASLERSIIGLAQDFVGSNNINFLQQANGSRCFGSRLEGREKHSSAIHLHTVLSPITRTLFPEDDDNLLEYPSCSKCRNSIEPTWYMPVIPTVLVNGSERTGTEWDTYIPKYDPRDIVTNIKLLLNDEPMKPMVPWYKGFSGSIEESGATQEGGLSYTCAGIIRPINNTTLRVTELPVGQWIEDYCTELLEKKEKSSQMLTGSIKDVEPCIKDVFVVHHVTKGVDLEICLSQEEDMTAVKQEDLLKKFNLTKTISTSNMYLFDSEGTIKKYETPELIIKDFFHLRLAMYERRKESLLQKLQLEYESLGLDVSLSAEEKSEKLRRKEVDITNMSAKSAKSLWIQDLDALLSLLDKQDTCETGPEGTSKAGNKRERETQAGQQQEELVTDALKSPDKKNQKLTTSPSLSQQEHA